MPALMLVLVVASGLLASAASAAGAKAPQAAVNESKIIGGSTTDIEDAVWMVQIWGATSNPRSPSLCAGTRISLYHVLTAGHCMENYRKNFLTSVVVTYGHTEQNFRENKRQVTAIHFHPQYRSRRAGSSSFGYVADYDVAVLLLHQLISDDLIGLPAESASGVPAGKQLRIAGWGRISPTSTTSTNLQSAVFTVLSRAECTKRMSPVPIRDHEFCVEETTKHAQCRGDSGGPAYVGVDDVQFGVVSWGNCGTNGASVLVDLSKKVIRDFVKKFVSSR